MTRERVDELLACYKRELGRSAHLSTELSELEMEIEREKKAMVEDIASVGAQKLTGMPKGNSVGNPTERIAVKLADGWKSERLLDLEERWLSVKAAFDESDTKVSYVNAWLSGLTARERWIIEHQVIEGEFWKVVITGFQAEFSEYISKDTLKRLRARAKDKIYDIAQV